MTYTFTEKELECFLNWAWPAECEIGLCDFETELRDKLRKILNKSFDEMDNSEKIEDFLVKCNYHWSLCYANPTNYFIISIPGKEEKHIPVDMDYTKAVKEIVNYYEN